MVLNNDLEFFNRLCFNDGLHYHTLYNKHCNPAGRRFLNELLVLCGRHNQAFHWLGTEASFAKATTKGEPLVHSYF
jgi:hypothetical protein